MFCAANVSDSLSLAMPDSSPLTQRGAFETGKKGKREMLNKVILMGRLTRSPELRHTQSGIPVVTFTLAVDRGYSRREDSSRQTADFINVVAWRGTAEFVSKWFSKGQLVAVSGRLQSRTYGDRDGNNRVATEVVADEVFFAESKKKEPGASAFESFGDLPESEDFAEVSDFDPDLPY